MTWIIAATAGRWQKHSIEQARFSGLKVMAIDGDPDADGLTVADIGECIDISDANVVVETIMRHGVVPLGTSSFTSEAGMLCAAALREYFNLPGLRIAQTLVFTDKGYQRQRWEENGVPCPRWRIVESPKDLKQSIVDFGCPTIVKPTVSAGSRGITKISSEKDDIAAAFYLAQKNSRSAQVIVEQFMNGTEYTAEVFAYKGTIHVLAITEKKKVPGSKGTIACELATPNISEDLNGIIEQAVIDAFTALGLIDGPGHGELIVEYDGSIGLVEVHARGGGFLIFDKLVPAVSGVNIAQLTALTATNQLLNHSEIIGYRKKQSVVLRWLPSRPGTVKTITGITEANLYEGVEAGSFVRVGDTVSSVRSDGDRLGYILSQAETPRAAQAKADAAEQHIRFTIDEK